MYYNPWKEDRYGGIDEEIGLRKQGFVRTEESATCMVRLMLFLKLLWRNFMMLSLHGDKYGTIKSLQIAETSVTPTMLLITGSTFIFFYLLPITVLPIIYSR